MRNLVLHPITREEIKVRYHISSVIYFATILVAVTSLLEICTGIGLQNLRITKY